MDKLEEIFKMQYELNKRIGVDTAAMGDDERVKWVLNYSRALGQENAELVDSVPWKWWAKYQKFDPQNARVEVVDMLHFIVSLAQTLGMSADDFFIRPGFAAICGTPRALRRLSTSARGGGLGARAP